MAWLIAATLVLVGGGVVVATQSHHAESTSDVAARTSPALALTGRVVDAASMLNVADKAELTGISADLDRDTRVQLVFVTSPSLGGEDIG